MPWTIRYSLAAAGFAAMLLAGGGAAAQEHDAAARYDTRDILDRWPHDPEDLPSVEDAGGRAVTFSASLETTYTTNAGSAPSDAVDALYFTPGLGIGVTPVSFGGWEVGGGALLDGDYYTSSGDNDDFGEGRLEGFVFATHSLAGGAITAEAIVLGIFDYDFSEHDLNLYIGDLTFSKSIGGFSFELSGDLQHSDVAEMRRVRVVASAGYAWAQPLWGHEISIEGDVAFSDFFAGANRSRNDVVAGLVLEAQREFARGWSLDWEAAYINRFSNRESARFEAVDVTVELSKRF